MNRTEEIVSFLSDLDKNNNRAWFGQNKERYLRVQNEFYSLVDELILGISQFDPTIQNLCAKDCTYRIYRDIRFSKDKSPYKIHMGAYICRGGKKSGYSGYYFHVGTGLGNEYPHSHMLAIGDYMCDPRVLKVLREDICYDGGEFQDIINRAKEADLMLDEDNSLRRVPSGFAADSPFERYLRLRNFCLYCKPDNKFMMNKNVVANTLDIFRSAKPFLDYVNRAIEYVNDAYQN